MYDRRTIKLERRTVKKLKKIEDTPEKVVFSYTMEEALDDGIFVDCTKLGQEVGIMVERCALTTALHNDLIINCETQDVKIKTQLLGFLKEFICKHNMNIITSINADSINNNNIYVLIK